MAHKPIRIALVGNFSLAGRSRLEAKLEVPHAFVEVPDTLSLEKKLARLEGAEVIVSTHLTAEMARRAPGLWLVHVSGAGVELVDRAALPPGARVANCFHHGVGIAEYIFALMLAVTREIPLLDRRLRRGDWTGSFSSRHPMPPPAPELRGKTLLLLGLGNIGREVARRARAFEMRVVAIRRRWRETEPVPGVERCAGLEALDELLGEADYVVVALPLGAETRGLIGAARLARMKPSAYIVNVGRGPILEEEALYRALAERRIAGLGMDVWYAYPTLPIGDAPVLPSRFPFHELDNVVMTPHVAGWTEGTAEGRFRTIAENINRLVRGEPLINQVYPPPT